MIMIEVNDLVSLNIIQENTGRRRISSNRDTIERILIHERPEKLKLQVLVDAFNSFLDVAKAGSYHFPLFALQDEFEVKRIIFPYDGKDWCGTVDCRVANYNKRNVLFTNIKLPNDGFFYGSDYLDEIDDIIDTEETQFVVQSLLNVFPSELGVGDTEVNYKLQEGRFEIYQWNDDGSKCLTIKFEYGTYECFQNKKKFTLRKLKQLFEKTPETGKPTSE